MQTLYPEIDPFHHFYLDSGGIHQIYVEQCGNPAGFPVVFLHGGPCSGCRPEHRRFFDPDKYHIILLDQRGSGRSRPFGELEQNNTQALLNDLENIRTRLNISTWLLFAGSWGATLALLYAQHYPEQVAGLILRGVFLARQRDMDWFIEGSAGRIYPECWQKLLSGVRMTHPDQLLEHLVQAVFSSHKEECEAAALAWANWGAQTALGPLYQKDMEKTECDDALLRQVRMELHYAHNHYFIQENQILELCHLIQHIPTHIIHGRLDLVCPAEAGFSLSQALPKAKLDILPNSGHIAAGDEMIDALITATDDFLQRV